jgi:hypothetical protein
VTGLKLKAALLGLFDTEDHWRLIISLPLNEVPSFISRGAAHQQAWALSASEGRIYVYLNLASKFIIHERTGFFYVPQSWDRCFTSPLKEGMLRIFSNEKIWRLWSGVNLQSWVPEASMLTTRPPKPLSDRVKRYWITLATLILNNFL